MQFVVEITGYTNIRVVWVACLALPGTWVQANSGTHAEPLYIYVMIPFLRGQEFGQKFFRLGLSMGFSELEFLGQIASFERRLPGARYIQ